MSGSTKLWVDDTMYLVDDEVAEFIEQLQSQLAAAEEKNKRLKGEKPIPFAWWKDCPGLAQKTMERTIERNERLLAINDDLVAKLAAEQEDNKGLREELAFFDATASQEASEMWSVVLLEREKNKRLREIVEIIMTQHWDMAACNCWVCTKGREAGCSPMEKYLPMRKKGSGHGRVTVEPDGKGVKP